MGSSVFKKAVRVSPFLVLLALSLGSVFYFSSAELLRNVLSPTWFFKDLPGSAAYRPEISVICPPITYELETVRLTIIVRHKDGAAKPLRFSVESPAEVEVQGTKERLVRNSESWFLLPKEQGEYVIVVRGLADARSFTFEQHLSVRKFDGFTRRQFVFWTAVGSIVGFIGTVIAWLTGRSKKPKGEEASVRLPPSRKEG
jgi:hypothetical protein